MALCCLDKLRNINNILLRTSYVIGNRLNRNFTAVSSKTQVSPSRSPYSIILINVRNKYAKSSNSNQSKGPNQEDSDDEPEDDFEDLLSDKKTLIKTTVGSLRADLLLKSGIGMARNKIETAFYENRIRINGRKLLKKSATCHVGDEIDLIKGDSPTNPNHIVIGRVEIVSATPKEEGISVTMKRYKNLTIEKYE